VLETTRKVLVKSPATIESVELEIGLADLAIVVRAFRVAWLLIDAGAVFNEAIALEEGSLFARRVRERASFALRRHLVCLME